MNDIFSPEISLWHEFEAAVRRVTRAYGYNEIRTPVLEATELFKRGVGEDTDIVEKEMYTFSDRNGDSLTLRPEGTAGAIRAVLEHGLLGENPLLKIYYSGPMYRHERPQKGRYRQFYQFGVELLGTTSAHSDVEVMALQYSLLKQLGLHEDVELHISSVGCDSCRPPYKAKLQQLLESQVDVLPEDAKKRLKTSPQRLFDHKDPKVQEVMRGMPRLLDHLCDTCSLHHESVQKGLSLLKIPYVVDANVVRGLDYYTQTAFEFTTTKLGSQSAVCGGGRYNRLVKDLGGPETPGIGFGVGIERICLLLEQKRKVTAEPFDIVFVYPDSNGSDKCFELSNQLRDLGIRVDVDTQGRSMKAQMKRADKLGAKWAVIIGGSEIEKGVAVVKDMTAGSQKEIKLVEFVIEAKNVFASEAK